MHYERVAKTAVATAAVLLIAACGGGGGSEPAPPPQASLQVSGTAATGLALANSTVEVKCAKGSGTATTDANGAYTLSMTGGALPCMIKVTGTAGGVAVTLHSVTESGSADSATGVTAARANVTPLTELIVAQLAAALPADVFSGFGADNAGAITQEKLATATTALLAALKDAGIDLGTIDPFKTELIAATPSAPSQGNDYDKLLDKLGESITPESLPQVVNQLATAVASGSSTALTEVAAAVEGGYLPGCPTALSGKYRTIDYWGRTFVRQIDFKTMKFNRGDGQPLFDITADAAKPCEFTVSGTFEGKESRFDVVMARSGAGAYRSENITDSRSTIGYIFPAQALKTDALAGAWTFLQSGYLPGDGVNHFPGQLTFKADGKVDVCDYDPGIWSTCTPDTQANLGFQQRTDGGVDLLEGSGGTPVSVAQLYGFRAPNGTLTVFGTTNATGANTTDTEQTSIVGTRLQKLAAPAVGDTAKYWDLLFNRSGGVNNNAMPSADSYTVKSIDSGGGVTRKRASDGREDTVKYNYPMEGLRYRFAGNWNGQPYASVIQFPVPGLGAISINSMPSSPDLHIYAVSVTRP